MNNSKKFVASFSGGKDSFLAFARACEMGMQPASLLTTFRNKHAVSCFHGIPRDVLHRVSKSLQVPIHIMDTGDGEEYTQNFEKALSDFKSQGVEACVFGDIDIIGHLEWCTERCENVGIEAIFPLWRESRSDLVLEFIDRKYKAMITVVHLQRLSEKYLGQTLTKELIKSIEADGADVCGENGEYHTFVYDGADLFKTQLDFEIGEKIYHGDYASLMVK